MKDSDDTPAPVLAAGGIVLRGASPPQVAVVRLRKNKSWVLPKGKLKPGEDTLAAARREVLEETGHDVTVHEFLGALSHASDRRHKVVHFWRMQASAQPVRPLMADVKAVKWLPLKQAVAMLTRPHEKVFLAQVGPAVVKAAKQAAREAAQAAGAASPVAPVPSAEAPVSSAPETARPAVPPARPAFVTATWASTWSWLQRMVQSAGRRPGAS